MVSFDIYYKYRFEWDADKAASNLRKHGVSFEEATTVFYDPDRMELPDGRHSTKNEIRAWVVGQSDLQRHLLVVYTERTMGIKRVISARRLNRKERKQFYET